VSLYAEKYAKMRKYELKYAKYAAAYMRIFFICGIISAYAIFDNAIICEKYAMCVFLQNMRSDRLKNYSGKLPFLRPKRTSPRTPMLHTVMT